MVLAVKLEKGEHVSQASIDGKPIPAYYEADGFGYIYLPVLSKKNYTLEYKISDRRMNRHVYNSGTYNVYNVIDHGSSLEIDLKMYGEQVVEIHTPKPASVMSSNENLLVTSFSYDDEQNIAYLTINGRNIQGERGIITLEY